MVFGRKKRRRQRRDIQRGQERQEALLREGVALQQPFVDAGSTALSRLNSVADFDPNDIRANPLFAAASETFQAEDDRLQSVLAAQGVNLSGANIAARERLSADINQRTLNTLLQLNQGIAGQGQFAATNQAGLLSGAAGGALNAGFATANTRQGFLDGISNFGNALTDFRRGLSGDSGDNNQRALMTMGGG